MARQLKVGDEVYVPRARLGLSVDAPSAFYQTVVRAIIKRSVQVDLPNGDVATVASSAAHTDIGVLIARIGDFETESSLLDPLKKSLLQYCRLLLPDEMVVSREVRSRAELRYFWEQDHGICSHLVLIAHGRRDAIRFGADDWVTAAGFADVLTVPGVRPKVIVSLACTTGYAAFAQELSTRTPCRIIIAPFHSVHGAVASQFCQTFLAHHFLGGETPSMAFRHARSSVPGAINFRLWEAGMLR